MAVLQNDNVGDSGVMSSDRWRSHRNCIWMTFLQYESSYDFSTLYRSNIERCIFRIWNFCYKIRKTNLESLDFQCRMECGGHIGPVNLRILSFRDVAFDVLQVDNGKYIWNYTPYNYNRFSVTNF